ncbi:5918_t:CDS:2 [Scutellospora calospora]|uniref:5918_t:CDS:1 n=1 Tax=Scutellospora calospora TaxID=85575 RepID=A0ACA9KDH1_9GLOM|nr:5918_t:CDS:2 [Scutellospora calospora]
MVAYRNQFLEQMAVLRPRMATYEGESMEQVVLPNLPSNISEIILVTHDESVFYANDGITKTWGPANEHQIQRKSQGLSIHVSEFICESIGHLCLSEEDKVMNDLLPNDERIPYNEAYVTHKDFMKQVVERAIPIFEQMHPGKTALFMFDNSCSHNAYANDALVVLQMNLKDEGKQPLLRDGKMPDSSVHIMTFVDEDGIKKPKGIQRILEECGLWIENLQKKCESCKLHIFDSTNEQYCATHILSCQPDFMSQKNHLKEVIEAAEHICIFYPKFHCELNYIEAFWRDILRFARRSERFMSAYAYGLLGRAAIFAVKKYWSHRCVPLSILYEFGHLNSSN